MKHVAAPVGAIPDPPRGKRSRPPTALDPCIDTGAAPVHISGMEDETPRPPRRKRYQGTHPRRFEEKYKERDPARYAETVAKVIASGKTPAGSHVPILVDECLVALRLVPGMIGVDATLGFGGHAERILGWIAPGGKLIGLDQDPIELPKTEARLHPDRVVVAGELVQEIVCKEVAQERFGQSEERGNNYSDDEYSHGCTKLLGVADEGARDEVASDCFKRQRTAVDESSLRGVVGIRSDCRNAVKDEDDIEGANACLPGQNHSCQSKRQKQQQRNAMRR